MSTHKDLIIIKARNPLERTSRRIFKAMPSHLWRQETPKRSASRSKLSVDKKIKKIDKTKLRNEQKSLKKKQQQPNLRIPNPPHNTTQYIISANTHDIDNQNLYTQNDRIEYDFEHHAMAGSMMDLMRDKFMHMFDQSTTAPSQGTQDTPLLERQSFEEELVEEKEPVSEVVDYSVYLKQAEKGEDLQGLVRHLVSVLAKKDEQISLLQSGMEEQKILDTEKS